MMALFTTLLSSVSRLGGQIYLVNEFHFHKICLRSCSNFAKLYHGNALILFLNCHLTNFPHFQCRNVSIRISSKSDNISAILTNLNEIFKLKDGRATSLVIENSLKTLTFHYDNLQKEEKDEFFKTLATKYAVDHDHVLKISKQLTETEPQSGLMLKTEEKLRDALTPQFSWLFTYLGRLDNGVKFLVDMRRDILVLLTATDVKSPYQLPLQHLSKALKKLLNLWFSVGFLNLERVTWSSPCVLLQKISEYEAVHPVRSWTDIRQRVGPYRRCFVYTHHSMPGEPLVVLHVALTKEISDSMKSIINRLPRIGDEKVNENSLMEEKQNIKAFIFYSISSTQKGLQGIDLGNYLIKRAAKELHLEHPQVTLFSSLSPIPSYREWLLDKIKLAEKGEVVFPENEWEEVVKLINPEDQTDAWAKLRSMISDNSWLNNENIAKALKSPLLASCSRYLYVEKRRGYAFDSVANFHLRNGAVMWRLNWLADTSPRGLSQSCGLMVNYRYYLDVADKNSKKYIQEGYITASEQIKNLAQHGKIESPIQVPEPTMDLARAISM